MQNTNTLTITDSTNNVGSVVGKGHTSNNGNILIQGTCTVNIYDGNFTSTNANVPSEGGVFEVSGTSVVNMYGGTISGGQVRGNGGNVLIRETSTFNMYDGNVVDGKAKASGGNFCVYGKLYIYGGTVSDGDSAYAASTYNTSTGKWVAGYGHGGNIYISGIDAEFTVTNAKIIGGGTRKDTVIVAESTRIGENYGGNIAVMSAGAKKFELGAGTEISGGYAHRGGNLYIEKPTNCAADIYNIDGATIKDGQTSYAGANVCLVSDSSKQVVLNLKSGTISLPDGSGAIINVSVGAGAAAKQDGDGNISAGSKWYGKVIVTGGEIKNGKICLYPNTELVVTAPGKVTNCTRAYGTYITNFTDANWGTATGVTIPNP